MASSLHQPQKTRRCGAAWDATTGVWKLTFEGHSYHADGVALSPDGKVLASASCDLKVRLWDVATGAWKQTLEGHHLNLPIIIYPPNLPVAVAFSPDGKVLASASSYIVRLCDATTGAWKLTFTYDCYDSSKVVAFSPDGKVLVSNSGYRKTDRGLLSLNPSSVDTCPHQEPSFHGIGYDREWVTRDGQNLLWLPPE